MELNICLFFLFCFSNFVNDTPGYEYLFTFFFIDLGLGVPLSLALLVENLFGHVFGTAAICTCVCFLFVIF
jgi:hypothetical protein